MCLATFDVKERMYNFSCNSHDTQVAIVANKRIDESLLQVYDVGRFRSKEKTVCFFCDYFDKLELVVFVILD